MKIRLLIKKLLTISIYLYESSFIYKNLLPFRLFGCSCSEADRTKWELQPGVAKREIYEDKIGFREQRELKGISPQWYSVNHR